MMGISWTACMAMFAFVFSQIATQSQVTSGICNPACGYFAMCENSTCTCSGGFQIHKNGKDCKNATCINTDCLQCESPVKCIRCESFISPSTGICLKKCQGSAEVINDSFICTACDRAVWALVSHFRDAVSIPESGKDNGGVHIVIAVVSGVAAGTGLCIIVIAGACLYIRRTRRNINLQNKDYSNRHLENGHMKPIPAFENNAYETDNLAIHTSSKVDPTVYANELEKLRPHAETLEALLSQVRNKTRAMDTSDERVPTYKGVIHQLCRVLMLIHNKDPAASIPSDALGLIQWAHQMLEDHREQQTTGEDVIDFPIAQISATNLDFDNPANPVYATPERNHLPDPASAILQSVATPYSSVPIPVSENEQQHHHYGTGKRPGFATISRARAKPNSELIRALEAEFNNTRTLSAPIVSEYESALQYQNSGFKREDLQNFIIHSGEKSDFRNTFDHNIDNTLQTSEKHTIPSDQNNAITRNFSLELKEKLKNRLNKKEHKKPFSSSAKPCHPQSVTEDQSIVSQQSTKKNIITNPNALKKANSLPNKHPKYATPHIGYFANGHYYDPKPMPNTDAEVYAPGSSYSDQSNAMSTFLGDLPRDASSSEPSEDGDEDSETSGGDLDVFPFDPKDCTEPVEV